MIEFVVMIVLPFAAFMFLMSGIIHYMLEEKRKEQKDDLAYLERLIEKQTLELIRRMEEDDE